MHGHTRIKTTQIYAKIVDRNISDDMNLLKSKLGLYA
jgi:site-specific recombinase XerD